MCAERCKHGSEASSWKPTVEIRQGTGFLAYGLTAQYLVLFVAGLLGVFVCFAGMYMSGVPQGFCILFALAAGLAVTGGTFYLSLPVSAPTDFKSSWPRAGIRGASSIVGPSGGCYAFVSLEP